MSDSVNYKELVEKAQHGDGESLNRLSEHARQQLYTYVFRLTMRDELSQDVVQESMLEMFRFLDKLERADRFWPWLRRIALNKVYHHYTREKARRTVPLSEEGYAGVGEQEHEGLANLVSQELKQIVRDTMVHLRARYREVLVMRCYEDMGYAQIAEELGCTEFNARVLFFRAKKSLAKQLSRRGLGKGALLTALVVFGKMTAPSEAAAGQIAVTAAATKVGVTAALAGTAGSKAGIVSLAAAGVITVGAVMVTTQTPPDPPGGSGISTVSVTNGLSDAGQVNLAPGSVQIPGNVEQDWWFFPDGPDKSVMMRKMKPDRHGKQPYCVWLQNNLGNYYFDRKRSTVYKTNHRMYSEKLSVMRLPTDSPAMSLFISRIEGKSTEVGRVAGIGSGTLVIATPRAAEGGGTVQVIQHPSVLYEQYYQYDWPADVRVEDRRDEMHRRGWTYFTVTGEIAGESVKGLGCLPFVYESSLKHKPWLKLQLGDRLIIEQTGEGTQVFDSAGRVRTTFAAEALFAGFGRPWMGLHTIDMVRRDAAGQEVRFETRKARGKDVVEVELTWRQGRLIYEIDMQADVIRTIRLYVRDAAGIEHEGTLNFSYNEHADRPADEIMTPGAGGYTGERHLDGVLWPLYLAQKAVAR